MRYCEDVSHGTLKPDETIPAIVEALAVATADGITEGDIQHRYTQIVRILCNGQPRGQSDKIPEDLPEYIRNQPDETHTGMLDALDGIADHYHWAIETNPGDGAHIYLRPMYTLGEVAEMYADAITEHTRPQDGTTFVRINVPDPYHGHQALQEITTQHLMDAHPESFYHQPGDPNIKIPRDEIMQICADAIRAHAYWARYTEEDQTHSANEDDIMHDSVMNYLQALTPYTYEHLQHAQRFPHVMLPLIDDARQWEPEDNTQQNLQTAYAEHHRMIAQTMAHMLIAARREANL